MIKVSKVLKSIKAVAVKTLPIAQDEEALLVLIEQSVNHLYQKFNMNMGTEVVITMKDKFFYELYNEDVNQLLSIHTEDGNPYNTNDFLDSKTSGCKIVNYKSFSLSNPDNGSVVCVYSKAPEEIETVNDVIDLPAAFFNALHMHVAFLAHTSINQDQTRESDTYLARYIREEQTLIDEGYKIQIHTDMPSTKQRGFI